MPHGAFALMETREEVNEMLKLDDYINLIIPRGSNEFVKYIQDNSEFLCLDTHPYLPRVCGQRG